MKAKNFDHVFLSGNRYDYSSKLILRMMGRYFLASEVETD